MKEEHTKNLNHIELVIIISDICLIKNGIIDFLPLQKIENATLC